MSRWDGDDLYWTELRPTEGGRQVIVGATAMASNADVTPAGFNARTRVHEYGGGDFAVSGGTVWFANFDDQRIYLQERGASPWRSRRLPTSGTRTFSSTPRERRIFAVREDHTTGAPEAVNTLVALDWKRRSRCASRWPAGNDFYSSPKLSPDGKRLAWLTWNHPNMPWDGTELWVGELDRRRQRDVRAQGRRRRHRVDLPTRMVAGGRAVLHLGSQRLVEHLPGSRRGRRAGMSPRGGVRSAAVGLRHDAGTRFAGAERDRVPLLGGRRHEARTPRHRHGQLEADRASVHRSSTAW